MTNALAGKLATNGNGSSLTNLNASAITSGTIPAARVGDISGNAASADTVDVANSSTNSTFYPTFTDNNGSGKNLYIDNGSGLTFNPSTNVLSAGTFSGSGASLTSLNADNISSGTLASARIEDSAVIQSKIANGAVTGTKLADDAVGTAKIADGAVNTARLANSAVNSDKLDNGAVTFAKFQNLSQDRIIGRTASGSGSATDLTASQVRSLINVEDGATADQSASEIATALRGQTIGTSTNGVHDVYNDDWFRNNNTQEGMYNQATGQHWYSDNDDYWNIAGGSSANGIRFRDEHNGTIRGYVYANNSNQIGFLNTGANWSFKVDDSGNCTATGNVTAYSDARLKTNVNTIDNALDIVDQLRGVSFDWIESGKHSIGVIAQEVEKVLPELVITQEVTDGQTEENPNPETKEIKSVDYGKMVGVLINAIKELRAEVDELKGGK